MAVLNVRKTTTQNQEHCRTIERNRLAGSNLVVHDGVRRFSRIHSLQAQTERSNQIERTSPPEVEGKIWPHSHVQ